MKRLDFLVFCGSLVVSLLGSRIVAKEVSVPNPPSFSYDDAKVYQLKVRGSYGRYITFVGRTINQFYGTPSRYDPGSQGQLSCTTSMYGSVGSTNCYRTGYRAPSYRAGTPGGYQRSQFRYELDCQDMTFDRKGDRLSGSSLKGWMDVSLDPTAAAVADRFCSQIANLPKVYMEDGKYVIESGVDQRKLRLVALATAKSICFQEARGMDSEKAALLSIKALNDSGITASEAVNLIKSNPSYSVEVKRFRDALNESTCDLDLRRYERGF